MEKHQNNDPMIGVLEARCTRLKTELRKYRFQSTENPDMYKALFEVGIHVERGEIDGRDAEEALLGIFLHDLEEVVQELRGH